MEKKTDIEDGRNDLREPRVCSRVDADHFLLGYNKQNDQRENIAPNSRCFSNPTFESSCEGYGSDENANGAATTSVVAGSKSTHLCPGDPPYVSSGKKNSHRGPLKKRSPKLSPSMQSKNSSTSTPATAATFTPLALRTQPNSSGFLSAGSISSTSSFSRRQLPASILKNGPNDTSYQLPVNRNLNNELMLQSMLATPTTVSSTGGRLPFSNSSLLSSNPRHASTSTPLPFSFSKRRKLSYPVVTNVSKINPTFPSFPNTPNTGESRGQGTPSASNHGIPNQTSGTTNIFSEPSPSINILRITHPFGDYPRVTVRRSRDQLISSPLATPTKQNVRPDSHLLVNRAKTKGAKNGEETKSKSADGKLPRNLLFSPIVRRKSASFDANKSERPPAEKSIDKKRKPRIKNESTVTKDSNDRNLPPNLFQNVPITKRPCKCKKSKCLKLYCECFHNATFCDPDLCHCKDCMNNEAHNSTDQPRGPRVLAMMAIMARRPDVFNEGGRRVNAKGCCGCQKSW